MIRDLPLRAGRRHRSLRHPLRISGVRIDQRGRALGWLRRAVGDPGRQASDALCRPRSSPVRVVSRFPVVGPGSCAHHRDADLPHVDRRSLEPTRLTAREQSILDHLARGARVS